MAKKRQSTGKKSHQKPGRFQVGAQFTEIAEAPAESGPELSQEISSGLSKEADTNNTVVDQRKRRKPAKSFEHRASVARSAIRWIASTGMFALAGINTVGFVITIGFAIAIILLILLISVPFIYGPFITW